MARAAIDARKTFDKLVQKESLVEFLDHVALNKLQQDMQCGKCDEAIELSRQNRQLLPALSKILNLARRKKTDEEREKKKKEEEERKDAEAQASLQAARDAKAAKEEEEKAKKDAEAMDVDKQAGAATGIDLLSAVAGIAEDSKVDDMKLNIEGKANAEVEKADAEEKASVDSAAQIQECL